MEGVPKIEKDHPAEWVQCFNIYSTGISDRNWLNMTVIDPGPYDEHTKKTKWSLGYSLTEKRFSRSSDLLIALEHDPEILIGVQWLIDHWRLIDNARNVGEKRKEVMLDRAKECGIRM